MVGSWKSSVSGPIPPHPLCDDKDRSAYCVPPQPRVKPEAESIARRGQKGCVGNLMATMVVDGEAIGHRKKTPKNHIQANVTRMRQIQRASHQRKEEDVQPVQPVKALWKSDKFSTVPSKIAEALQAGNQTPRPVSRNYLRAHSRSGPSRPGSRGPSPVPRLSTSTEQLSVPAAVDAKSVQMHRNDFDFIKINGINARHSMMKRSPSESALDDVKLQKDDEYHKYRRGVVPQYLRTRQKQWEKDASDRVASAPDPDCPPDHRLMPEAERRETLKILRDRYKALIDDLQVIPITSDTLRTKNKRKETEKKLEEVEEALRIFVRPKVFVKTDN